MSRAAADRADSWIGLPGGNQRLDRRIEFCVPPGRECVRLALQAVEQLPGYPQAPARDAPAPRHRRFHDQRLDPIRNALIPFWLQAGALMDTKTMPWDCGLCTRSVSLWDKTCPFDGSRNPSSIVLRFVVLPAIIVLLIGSCPLRGVALDCG